MDKLIAEKEKKVEIEKQKREEKKVYPKISIKLKEIPHSQTEYLNSFENLTVADIKKQAEKKATEEFKVEKETLLKQQFTQTEKQTLQKTSQKVIEKPNYDFIDENKKVVKLSKKEKTKHKSRKKMAGIMLACTLGISAVICITNTILLDNMNSNFLQIDETYKFNLASYLKNIYNLDTTKKGMEMIETYPEEILDAGDLGERSNWFDRLCNFIGGLFGG